MKIDNCNKIITINEQTHNITRVGYAAILKSWLIKNRPVNLLQIDFIGVNNIGFDVETKKIFFVSGYTPARGLFIEKY